MIKDMEKATTIWFNWCRLCAEEDSENNVSINFRAIHQPLPMGEDIKLTLKEALEKYFCVQSSYDDLLPKFLCIDCYALISSIISFNERVERVQKMYTFLMEHPLHDANELKSLRLKFMVSENQNYHFQTEHGSNRSFFCIKQESSDNDIYNSDLKETGVNNECFDRMDQLCDKVHVIKNGQDHVDEIPFEAMLEIDKIKTDSSSSVDETLFESVTKPRICTSRKKNIIRRKSKHDIRRTQLKDIKCKKKKKMPEDFTLDVNCVECGKELSLYSTFCEHMKECHGYDNIDKHWQCPLCERMFQPGYNFKRHMRIHLPLESNETIKCPQCENAYSTSAQLEAHINYKHRNKSFVCEECGICVRTNSNLRQHMLTHTDNTPFECEICKKKFKNKSRLKIHMDIHSPNKHVCAICGLQLNSRATLNRHFLVHSDEMQHKCDYCGRAFKRVKALKNHLILHTGLKPYSCDFCERTFANGSNCRSHMKKMHPNELASLEASGSKTHTKNIPKLETLKAVTKAADNLTPVVTKLSGCFAFGKKPKSLTDISKTSKPTFREGNIKEISLQANNECSSPLDLQNIPQVGSTYVSNMVNNTKVANTQGSAENTSTSNATISNFDNI